MENTDSTFEKACETLREMDLDPSVDENERVACTGMNTQHGPLDIVVHASDKPSLLAIVVRLPSRIPEDSRVRVAELITRANFGWSLGSVNMNMADGLLAWRGSMPIKDGSITGQQFQYMLEAGLTMMNMYYRAINRLIYADDLSPAEAVAEVLMAALPVGKREGRVL